MTVARIALRQHLPIFADQRALPDPCGRCDARERSVCSAIDEADLHRLAALAKIGTAQPGTSFIEEGEPALYFFNITRGVAKLYKLLPDGRRQITGFSRMGDFLGLAVSSTYAFSAEALDRVRFCRFSRRQLEGLLDDFPAFERRLLDRVSNELLAAQEHMLLLGRKTARERVASFLLAQEARAYPCGEALGTVHLPMTRSDIGDYLGLTIETVSRTLSQLKRDGIIAAPALTEIELRNREELLSIAGGAGFEL